MSSIRCFPRSNVLSLPTYALKHSQLFQLNPKMASINGPKRQRVLSPERESPYELFYWPTIPGRGEHIRLAFEAAKVPYTDVSNAEDAINLLLSHISDKTLGDNLNPPPFAPPILRHGDLLLSQTSNILLYLAPKLGLTSSHEEDPNGVYRINALALTALDGLSNEAHDTHHPIASAKYYEDQKEEAKRKATDYTQVRLPKFLGYFERVLSGEASQGGEWLYGGRLTYVDLVLFQTLDGVTYAFPKAVGKLKKAGKYNKVFSLVDRVRELENIKSYLESERRKPYSMGIYRYYEELDDDGVE